MAELSELQERIVATRAARGFTTDPVRLMCLLAEEVGEVASEIKKTWSANYPDIVVDDLRGEVADVYVLLTALAATFDIDLAAAVEDKFFTADDRRDWATAKPSGDQSDPKHQSAPESSESGCTR